MALPFGIGSQSQESRLGCTDSTAGRSSLLPVAGCVTKAREIVKPPLSVRDDAERLEAFSVLREGVPPGLLPSLLDWVRSHYTSGYEDYLGIWIVDFDSVRRLERRTNRTLPDTHELNALLAEFQRSHALLLDAIDLALTTSADAVQAAELSEMLDDARSTYTVARDQDGDFELQFRQPPELTEAATAVMRRAGSAAHHLRRSWSLAFGLEPDPTAACDEAVRAIEAAAASVVTPKDKLPTLGKMITAMRAAPHKWTTDSNAADDVGAVIAMMNLVWKGYKRHGDPNQPAEASVETSQMLVHSAALLSHWFQSDCVRAVTAD